MNCNCKEPRFCPDWNRQVRWCDIQSCRSNGPQSAPRKATPDLLHPQAICRDCIFVGLPVLAANGKQVGSEGCNCTGKSVPSGLLWWNCNFPEKQAKPTREDRAKTCPYFNQKKEKESS